MRVQVTFSGLLGTVTVAHIHCCVDPAGTVGVATQTPRFSGFPAGVTSGSYDQTFDMTLASRYRPQFITDTGGTPASAQAALFAGLIAGRGYLNIHTSQCGSGEIRGFLTPEPGTFALVSMELGAGALLRRRCAH
jgi:hypothetical protein